MIEVSDILWGTGVWTNSEDSTIGTHVDNTSKSCALNGPFCFVSVTGIKMGWTPMRHAGFQMSGKFLANVTNCGRVHKKKLFETLDVEPVPKHSSIKLNHGNRC